MDEKEAEARPLMGTIFLVIYLLGNRYATVYFMMRPKLLNRIEGCVQSYQSYDDGGI